MGAITSSQLERAEVDAVLQAGLFEKAPRLGKFFVYICDRYFEGNADQIKEYSIAVEALGRPADFDSKKDSIVRVEAHRLRKRLDEFYKGPGADHPIQIVIPNGQYKPQFIPRIVETAPVEQPAVLVPPPPLPATEPMPPADSGGGVRWVVMASLVAIALATVAFVVWHGRKPGQAEEVWSGTPIDPPPAQLAILAGYHGAPFTDLQGRVWRADAYYTGGTSVQIPADRNIEGLPDPRLPRTLRAGSFKYEIPVSPGTHELRLYFVETEYGQGNPNAGGDGSRTFDLTVNDQTLDKAFDPLAAVGAPNRVYIRVLKDVQPAADGKIHLKMTAVGAPAILEGFEVINSTPGRIQPVRIVAQTTPITDPDGRFWAADEYFYGGRLAFHKNGSFQKPERALFQGERYGNFSYRIPLAPGKYKLTLRFVETWFGTENSNFAPLDSRVFDVFANGVALLRNFNIGKEAGGPNLPVEESFDNLEPDAQGLLVLSFSPVKNYALVNAIEVVSAGN